MRLIIIKLIKNYKTVFFFEICTVIVMNFWAFFKKGKDYATFY